MDSKYSAASGSDSDGTNGSSKDAGSDRKTSSSEEEEEEEPWEQLTDAEMNKLASQLLKAEIMGDEVRL